MVTHMVRQETFFGVTFAISIIFRLLLLFTWKMGCVFATLPIHGNRDGEFHATPFADIYVKFGGTLSRNNTPLISFLISEFINEKKRIPPVYG